VIGLYGSSPKVKCREDMRGASQLIAELKIPRRDRVPISPDDRLEFFGDRLRFEKSSPRWRIVRREEIEEMEEGSTEIERQRSKTTH